MTETESTELQRHACVGSGRAESASQAQMISSLGNGVIGGEFEASSIAAKLDLIARGVSTSGDHLKRELIRHIRKNHEKSA